MLPGVGALIYTLRSESLHFCGLRCIIPDSLTDHLFRQGIQVVRQDLVHFQELGPEDIIHKRGRCTGHHRGVTLPVVAIRRDVVLAQDGHEQLA